MNKNKLEVDLHELISSSMSGQIDLIDGEMSERLKQARLHAVASGNAGSWGSRSWQVVSKGLSNYSAFSTPVAQVSLVMLVTVFSVSLLLIPQSQRGADQGRGAEIQQNGNGTLSEMDVLMSNEDMEFLENLEIYEWLAAEYG